MSNPLECAATFLKTWKSTLVGHLGLQSIVYHIEFEHPVAQSQILRSTLYQPWGKSRACLVGPRHPLPSPRQTW